MFPSTFEPQARGGHRLFGKGSEKGRPTGIRVTEPSSSMADPCRQHVGSMSPGVSCGRLSFGGGFSIHTPGPPKRRAAVSFLIFFALMAAYYIQVGPGLARHVAELEDPSRESPNPGRF